jgi:hypothetical protein
MACYGDNFTPLYIDDVRTSQEALAFTTCYRASSGILRHVALVRTDVSEEHSASIRVTRIGG